MLASGFPAVGAKRRGGDVPFGGSRPPSRNLAVGRYGSGVSLVTPRFERGTRAPRARAVNLPRALCTSAALKKATQATAVLDHTRTLQGYGSVGCSCPMNLGLTEKRDDAEAKASCAALEDQNASKRRASTSGGCELPINGNAAMGVQRWCYRDHRPPTPLGPQLEAGGNAGPRW